MKMNNDFLRTYHIQCTCIMTLHMFYKQYHMYQSKKRHQICRAFVISACAISVIPVTNQSVMRKTEAPCAAGNAKLVAGPLSRYRDRPARFRFRRYERPIFCDLKTLSATPKLQQRQCHVSATPKKCYVSTCHAKRGRSKSRHQPHNAPSNCFIK